MRQMRMSRQELLDELKQSDGDPHVKQRLRALRLQHARRRMMADVPRATVVVTKPTHYAVALRYVAGETVAPEVLAKGVDSLALRIRKIAAENGVPVIENAPLARALHAACDVGNAIPVAHYQAVAEIIAYVLRLGERRPRH
jgi:flagellar biosynthetic protein FlhB